MEKHVTLGSKWISKRIGVPVCGTVVGCELASIYGKKHPQAADRWNELYPNWQDDHKLVYYLLLPEPVRCLSQEEYDASGWCDIPYEELPLNDYFGYPEDDLEPL